MLDNNHKNHELTLGEKRIFQLYIISSLSVFLLMMIAGSVMRFSQAEIVSVGSQLFYELLTVHGAGMVGISGLVTSSIMWYFLRRYVTLSPKIFLLNYIIFLVGVVFILGAIFLGKFAAGWTFLYPLPAISAGVWSKSAAMFFLIGLLTIGVGFLILYLDVARALIKKYGSLYRSLGVHYLFNKTLLDENHPTTVVASSMVLIVNTIGILVGAVILVVSIFNLIDPNIKIDPLLAKNLIYFFGHVFINATIYMAVTAVYEILPLYTKRPWKVSKWFLAAWLSSTVFVMMVYPHHLLMDFVQPTWLLVVGQILSYMNGIPVLVVTAYGALTLVYKSGIKWDLCSRLLFLSMFGWSAGAIPAIIDATITVNLVMHNTMWVPGHFHFYLLLGLLPMILGFMIYTVKHFQKANTRVYDEAAFSLYLFGSLVLSLMFLLGGSESVPRRWAVHFPEWIAIDQAGSLGAAMILFATTMFIFLITSKLKNIS